MARMSGETLIRQKIAELTQQISHFEQCIEKAKEHCNGLTNCNNSKTIFDKLSQNGELQNG